MFIIIIFVSKILLFDHLQLAKFGTLKGEGGKPLSNNFRPTQPIGDRTVSICKKSSDNLMIDSFNQVEFVQYLILY